MQHLEKRYHARTKTKGLLIVPTIWDPGDILAERKRTENRSSPSASTSAPENTDFDTLVDTGADINVLSRSVAEALGLNIRRCRTWIKMGKGGCRAWGRTKATLTIAGHTFTAEFIVIDGLNQRAILGMSTMRAEGAVINCADNKIVFAPRPWTLHDSTDSKTGGRVLHLCTDHGQREKIDHYDLFVAYVHAEPLSPAPPPPPALDLAPPPPATAPPKAASPTLQKATENLRDKYKDTVFSKLDSLPPRRGEWDFRIDLLDDTLNPVHQKHYKMSPQEKDAVKKELEKLRALGWIDTSSSAWSAPILFAKNRKKDGSLRAVYDFRALNARTRANSYPVPRIDDLLDKLAGADLFTLLDLAKAFNQVRVRGKDEEKTSISTPFGLWLSKVMLMGLRNSGPHFQALIDAVVRGDPRALPRFEATHPRYQEGLERLRVYLEEKLETFEDLSHCVAVYIDDIVVFSKGEEQHVRDVEKLLERLHIFDLRVNEFFEMGQKQIKFVGFRVGNGEVAPLPDRVQAISNWPTPTSPSDVKTFIGVVQYYRECIPQLAMFARVLTKLTSKTATWQWTDVEQHAFDEIKQRLVNATALMIPDATKPYVVATDASIYGIGGVLMQRSDAGDLRPVAFYSRQTSETESRWSQYELELKAIHACYKKWRHYLDGTRSICFTDHHTLVTGGIFQKTSDHNFNPKVTRMIAFLMQFDVDLRHQSATTKLAHVVDGLSRRPDYLSSVGLSKDLSTLPARLSKLDMGCAPPAASTLHLLFATAADPDPPADWLARIRAAWALRPLDELEERYTEHDGLWYFNDRLVVPDELEDLRKDIVRSYHALGHRGMTATETELRTRFYWRNMQTDVREIIGACPMCAKVKPRNSKRSAPIRPLPVPQERWREVELDFIVGLPPSGKEEFTSIATVVDRLTKEVILIPTWESVTAEQFAEQFLVSVWRHKGFPFRIITDCDPKFLARTWATMMDTLRIEHDKAAPYHHQTIGQAERMNRTVEEVLRTLVDKRTHKDWAQWYHIAEFAINATMQSSIGMSPFQATLGFQPRRGLLTDFWDLPAAARSKLHFLEHMHDILQQVQSHLETAQARMAQRATGPERHFHEGQRVWLAAEHIRQRGVGPALKLQDRWLGPFAIRRMLNDRTVELHLPAGCTIHNVINTSRLKPAHGTEEAPPDLELDEDGVVAKYEIEAILDHRTKGRGRSKTLQYVLVKWKGWSDEFNTWEPVEGLQDSAADLLRDYMDAHNLGDTTSAPLASTPASRPATRSRPQAHGSRSSAHLAARRL